MLSRGGGVCSRDVGERSERLIFLLGLEPGVYHSLFTCFLHLKEDRTVWQSRRVPSLAHATSEWVYKDSRSSKWWRPKANKYPRCRKDICLYTMWFKLLGMLLYMITNPVSRFGRTVQIFLFILYKNQFY